VTRAVDLHGKTRYLPVMSVVTVSSKGQVVLPSPLRNRLGLNAGARLEVLEERDGIKLKVIRAVRKTEIQRLAGMVKAKSSGRSRRLADFDAAVVSRRKKRR